MNIHLIVVIATLFFGFGYAYGDSKRLSFVKIVMTLVVVAPLGFQIYQTYATEYFVTAAISIVAGFKYGWDKEFPAGMGAFSLRRVVPMVNFGSFLDRRRQKTRQKERSEAEKQAELEKERRRRADEMKKEREHARRKAEAEAGQEKRQEQRNKQSENTPPRKPPEPVDNRTPEEILGLNKPFTKDELKTAFREKSKKVHPDNWNGMPKNLQKEMEEEQKRVNAAYEALNSRG